MSNYNNFNPNNYDDFPDEVKPIRDKVKKKFYDTIINYLDINVTPDKYYRKKKKHEKILNYYKEIVDNMKIPIIEMLLDFQCGLYNAIGEKKAPKIKFTNKDIIKYNGDFNTYYFPGDIIKFTTTDVIILDVDKIPFRYKRKVCYPPIRQRDITIKEKFLILEIFHNENGYDASLLLQDEKGYLIAIDYPSSCVENPIIDIIGTVLSENDADWEEMIESRNNA